MPSAKWNSRGFGVMGDDDIEDFAFTKPFTYDEKIDLLERNPRVRMLCDWMPGEAIKNGWEWEEEENFQVDIDGVTETLDKDNYLEYLKIKPKLKRGMCFAKLHGTCAAVFAEDFSNFKIYHRSQARSGWCILKADLGPDNKPKQITLRMYPEIDEPVVKPEPTESKIPIDRIVFIHNPMMGERWGGTPDVDVIAHAAQAEELILKLTVKHAMDVVNSFMWFKDVQTTEEAAELHAEYIKQPLTDFYTNNIEMEPMRAEIQGNANDFEVIINIMKKYMASGMNVSQQSLDGAPEGTLSSAKFNTIISYAVIKQIQDHFKPFIEEIFRKLGMKNPHFSWIEPIDDDAEGNAEDGDGEEKENKNSKREE